jgi:hypothetical protein
VKRVLWALFLWAWPTGVAGVVLDEFERRDYDLSVTTQAWAASPGPHKRLYLDVYNVTDFWDFETNNTPGFVDGTWLADTIRPTATLLWDDRYRIQLGVLAQKGYGDEEGFGVTEPWIQLLWQPARRYTVILGNLDIPHYYFPALFFPANYVLDKPFETGAQLLHRRENWYDDLFINYRLKDTPEHQEKFDLGFVHRNQWKFLRLNYQSHWTHQGGTLFSHPVDTINDVAQAVGGGVHYQPGRSWILGAGYHYLHSHRRVDAADPALRQEHNGNGNLYEAYLRWSRLKLTYQYWRGKDFEHESGDAWFTLPKVQLAAVRWDIIMSRDFNLLLDYTGYFIGTNDRQIEQYLKSAIHLQVTWQFSIPVLEWTTPAVTPEGPPIPARWDEGL